MRFSAVRQVKIGQTVTTLDNGVVLLLLLLLLLLLDVTEQQQTEEGDCQGYIFQHFFGVGVHCPRQQGDGETVSCGRRRGRRE